MRISDWSSDVCSSDLEALSTAGEFPSASEKKYHKLREELTAQVESVQFHNTKIEYLVDQLYSYNRRLTALGGQMLRLAERHKVPRKSFLDNYVGRSEEHTSELQSLMRISYAVFCLKKKKNTIQQHT